MREALSEKLNVIEDTLGFVYREKNGGLFSTDKTSWEGAGMLEGYPDMAEKSKDSPAREDKPYYGPRVLTKQEGESLRKKRKEDDEASRAWFRAHGVKPLR